MFPVRRKINDRLMSHVASTLAICFLMLLFLPFSAQAADDQAIVYFEEQVTGEHDGSFIARGNVRFIHDDMTIRADQMRLEPGGEIVHFTGNVEVENGDSVISGERYVYDMPAGTSVLFEAAGTVEVQSVEGPVYFRGDTMAMEKDRVVLTGAMFTTCSCETPGFYLAGSRMEIIPEHVMIIYNVRFVESGITFFYWPILTIPLSGSSRPPFQLPQIGHDAVDGWFVKTSIPYGPAGAGGGYVHVDWMQYTGTGVGVTHYYRDDASGDGQLHVYGLSNKRTETLDPTIGWRGSFTGNQWNSSWDAEVYENGAKGARRRQTTASVSLENRRPTGYITLRGSFAGTKTPTSDVTRTTGTMRLNQQLFGRTRLNVTGDLRLNQGTIRDRRLTGYRVDLSNNSGPVTWSIAFDESFNQELAKDQPPTTVPWRTVSRKPEIVLGSRPNTRVLGRILPLTLEYGFGSFTERRTGNQVVEDTRHTGLFQLRTMTLPLANRLSLGVGGYARSYWYGNGMARTILSTTDTLTYRMTDRLTLRTTYEYLDQSGQSPFNFDRITPRERIRGSAQYNANSVNITLSSGYNLREAYPEDLTVSLNATPFEQVSLRLQGRYSLRNDYLDYVVGSVEIGEEEPFSLKVGTKYSFVKESFERVDAALRWKTGAWDLSYGAIYDMAEEDPLTLGLVTVLRELDCDCRQVGISYDFKDRAIWLEYRITAIPSLGVKLGSEADGFMFDLEGWQELVEQ